MVGALIVLVGLAAAFSLVRYAPTGDVAQAAGLLAEMEQPKEAVALADPLLTEPFQDAYDGHLPVWGVATPAEVKAEPEAVWTVGGSEEKPAVPGPQAQGVGVRLQVGSVPLTLSFEPGRPFDTARLPIPQQQPPPRLGDMIELAAAWPGDATVRQGENLPLALAWRALAPPDASYTVFVQAIDDEGVKAGQLDWLPCGGDCLTTSWRPGDLIGEWYELPIRADAPPGRYQLIAGMYDLATGERLPVQGPPGSAALDYVPLGFVEVMP